MTASVPKTYAPSGLKRRDLGFTGFMCLMKSYCFKNKKSPTGVPFPTMYSGGHMHRSKGNPPLFVFEPPAPVPLFFVDMCNQHFRCSGARVFTMDGPTCFNVQYLVIFKKLGDTWNIRVTHSEHNFLNDVFVSCAYGGSA